MHRVGIVGVVSHGLGVAVTTMLVAGCGPPTEPSGLGNGVPELTFVGLEQYNTPALVSQSGEPTLYQVTVDVTLVFRVADQLETLVVDLDGPTSGRRSHHEFDLGALAPGIEAATQGRWELRVPLTIPELGALQFGVMLIDRNANTSRAVQGSFTVESALGANDATQTQSTEAGTTTDIQAR
jgi:hypothetical protein